MKRSGCFEIEVLATLENYFMAGEKECRCLCSVSNVYALPLETPRERISQYAPSEIVIEKRI